MQASNAPLKSAVPFADSGNKNAIPVASQIGVTPGAASFTDGFPPLTMTPLAAGGVPPYGADFNGILNFLSAAVRWAQAGGGYAYDGAFSTAVGGYPRGARVLSADGTSVWRSTSDHNTTDPDAGGVGWVAAAPVGLAGNASNLRSSLSTAAATTSFYADEVIVAAALGGQGYRLGNFSKTLNIATTGAGGMDSGAAPANGYVGIYAIYNPTTGASSLLARNATGALMPTIYGGANMPVGYTASALISVWPTNASQQLSPGLQLGARISIEVKGVLSAVVQVSTATPLSIAGAVPPNAKTVSGYFALSSSVPGAGAISVLSSATIGPQLFGPQMSTAAVAYSAPFNGLQLMTTQTIYYTATTSAGVMNAYIGISSYSI